MSVQKRFTAVAISMAAMVSGCSTTTQVKAPFLGDFAPDTRAAILKGQQPVAMSLSCEGVCFPYKKGEIATYAFLKARDGSKVFYAPIDSSGTVVGEQKYIECQDIVGGPVAYYDRGRFDRQMRDAAAYRQNPNSSSRPQALALGASIPGQMEYKIYKMVYNLCFTQ